MKQDNISKTSSDEAPYEKTIRDRNDDYVALKEITDGFRLRNNERNVAQQIKVHPILSTKSGPQLSAIRRSERRRDIKRVKKEASRVNFAVHGVDSNSDVAEENRQSSKDPDYVPGEATQPTSDARQVESGTEERMRSCNRKKAIQMIARAHQQKDGEPLREAVIKRLSQFDSLSKQEFEERCDLLIGDQSGRLAHLLVVNDQVQFDAELKAGAPKDAVILAFVIAADRCKKVVRDQQRLVQFFIPVLNTIGKLPSIPPSYSEGRWNLLRACIGYYTNCEDPSPPHQLYQFAHEFDAIRETFLSFRRSEKADRSLKRLLVDEGIDSRAIRLLIQNQHSLCFSRFIRLLQGLEPRAQLQLCEIIGKCDSDTDPSEQAIALASNLRRNVHLAEELQKRQDKIPLYIEELNEFMEAAEQLALSDLRKIVREPMRDDWLKQVQYLKLEAESGRSSVLRDSETWKSMASEVKLHKEYDEACNQSKSLERACQRYCHIEFQCFAAAKILGDNNRLPVVNAPTGVGKTYIAALLSKVYQDRGSKVALITSNKWLAQQMEEMMGDYRYEVQVYSMSDALANKDAFDLAIIDEADEAVIKHGVMYDPSSQRISGFWELMDTRCVLMSGSISDDLKTTLHEICKFNPSQTIDLDEVLRQQRIKATSTQYKFSISSGEEEHMESIQSIVADNFTDRPIVVFVATGAMYQKVAAIAKEFGVAFYDGWTEEKLRSTRATIRHNDRGIVILNRKFGRGSDVRFKIDSLVLVTFLPEDATEAKQMAGRSSRTHSTHSCSIVIRNELMTEEDVRLHISGQGTSKLKDGVQALRVLHGSRFSKGYKNDAELACLFERGWLINMSKVTKKLTKKKALLYENLYKVKVGNNERL